ncbi:MAG TPA: nucleoside-diphosphate kinase [Mycobacteriales bacterium]|nr:nucleoside-diphosphate kinase [Mycobacteriales bacterium]
MNALTAVIGSTAVRPQDLTSDWRREDISTGTGTIPVLFGTVDDQPVVYITRSGGRAGVAPHLVPYKANIVALRKLGVRRILATSVVGSLDPAIEPGTLVVLDQFLDFTRTRLTTMFGGGGFANVDVTDPYCPALRKALHSATPPDHPALGAGCYVGVDGPRYETRAEVRMYRQLGGDVIGMTNLPEVVLARESGLCYASLAVVSNPAAGLAPGKVQRVEHFELVTRISQVIADTIRGAISVPADGCDCADAAADFLTADEPAAPSPESPEWSLVLIRPPVVRQGGIGTVLQALEDIAPVRAIKTVHPTQEQIAAIYDREGIANLVPGIIDVHAGQPCVAVAFAGTPGSCERIEDAVTGLRDRFGRDALHNGIHASGDGGTGRREIAVFFDPAELTR